MVSGLAADQCWSRRFTPTRYRSRMGSARRQCGRPPRSIIGSLVNSSCRTRRLGPRRIPIPRFARLSIARTPRPPISPPGIAPRSSAPSTAEPGRRSSTNRPRRWTYSESQADRATQDSFVLGIHLAWGSDRRRSMKMQRPTRVLGLMLLTGLLSAGAAQAGARVFVRVGPPALIVETRPPAPYPNYVWRPGYHRWVGGQYVWAPGV